MTGFPLRLVNHTDLLSLSLIWGQRGGEEEEKEEEHHKLHPLCQYLISVCDLSAFLEFVILQSCFMFLHKWENYNSHSVQNIPCIQQKPIRPPTKLMECCTLSPSFLTTAFDGMEVLCRCPFYFIWKVCQSGIKWVAGRIKQEDVLEFFTAASPQADDRWLIRKRKNEGAIIRVYLSVPEQ